MPQRDAAAVPLGEWSSSCTLTGMGSRPSVFAAATKYAADPTLSFGFIGLVHDHRVDPDPCHHGEVFRWSIVDLVEQPRSRRRAHGWPGLPHRGGRPIGVEHVPGEGSSATVTVPC